MKQFKPHSYQEVTIKHIKDNPRCGIFLDMGMGKTVSTLTALNDLMYILDIIKPIVIAPKKVAESTWKDEIDKWAHLNGMTASVAVGTAKQRAKALEEEADIYFINRENTKWLCEYYSNKLPFDCVIIDELSSFKSPRSVRFKHLRKCIASCHRVIGLTGTPTPNGYPDLWAQIYLLDAGERLGKTLSEFRRRYLEPAIMKDHVVYTWRVRSAEAEKEIAEKISDICISMKAKDYLSMEEPTYINRYVELKTPLLKQYKEFEKENILDFLDSGVELTAFTSTALRNKLMQFANGAVYYEDEDIKRQVQDIHDEKIEALKEIIEEAKGQPVLVAYKYRSDISKIHEALKEYKPRLLETDKDIKEWNKGKIPVMLTHPKSAGHGLNLQDGGHILVWFGVPDGLEDYQQTNARLQRQGQKEPVLIYHLIVKGTEDEAPLKNIMGKDKTQEALLERIKYKIQEYM